MDHQRPPKKRRRDNPQSEFVIQHQPQYSWPQPTTEQFQQHPPSPRASLIPQNNQQTADVIATLNQKLKEFEKRLNEVRLEILRKPIFQQTLLDYILDIKRQISECLQVGYQSPSQTLFLQKQIFSLEQTNNALLQQFHQVGLYEQEQDYLKNPMAPRPAIACLFVTQHPFPAAIRQFNVVEPIVVKLLQGALSSLHTLTPVSINYEQSNPEAFGGNSEDLIDGVAVFKELQFLLGTGLRIKKLCFTVSVQQNQGGRAFLSCILDTPIVVLTNTKQWKEAQAAIFAEELFYQNVDCRKSLFTFCNLLQRTFVSAILAGDGYKRALGSTELQFLVQRMYPNFTQLTDTVAESGFQRFWAWYGPILHLLKFKRFYLELWNQGLLCGFIAKDKAEEMLANQKIGAFLLRFSASSDRGALAVAYQQGPHGVRHFIFPDGELKEDGFLRFIMDCGSLLYFLKLRTGGPPETVAKDRVFRHLGFKVKKKPKPKSSQGYDLDILASFLTNTHLQGEDSGTGQPIDGDQ